MNTPKINKPEDVVPFLEQVLRTVAYAVPRDASARLKTAFVRSPDGNLEFLTGFWQFAQSPMEPRRSEYSNLRLDDRSLTKADAVSMIGQLLLGPVEAQGVTLPKFYSPNVTKVLGRWNNERTEFSGWPEWTATFQVERPNGGRSSPPSTPVVGKGMRPYASGVQAVLDWVWNRGGIENHLPHENALVVVVPDYRCRIKTAEWRRGRVTVVVEGPEDDLELQVLVQAGGTHAPCAALTDLPRDEALEVQVPSETERVELYLVRASGELASHVVLHSAGEEFEAKPGRPSPDEQAAADLRNGEGQQVEFKPFIEPKHQKEGEVVESLVAFSNTEGGRLYIGVTKNGIPEGEVAMRKAAKADVEMAPKKIVEWVKNLATEKVKPDPDLQIQTVRVSGEVVVMVTIFPGAAGPYSTHANDVFIRSGATNRKPDPRTELPHLGSPRAAVWDR